MLAARHPDILAPSPERRRWWPNPKERSVFTPGEADSSRFSVRSAQPLPSHHQGLDFISPTTAPFPPGGHQAPGTDRENRARVSPPHLCDYRTRPFLGLRDKCRGGGGGVCVHECVCMCPCLRRTRRGAGSRTTPRGPARSPTAINPGPNGSYSQSSLRLVHV